MDNNINENNNDNTYSNDISITMRKYIAYF